MIKKQFLKSKPVCKVTFTVPAEAVAEAEKVQLVGEFSSWLSEPIDMKKQKDGSFRAIVDLETGKDYEFRYYVNGESFTNDNEADAYRSSGVSYEENSVLSL
jgi:1,4-alpha-glucan branching enzyme